MRALSASILIACCLWASLLSTASAGTIYRITSKDGDKTIAYDVSFGGGIMFERHTAFDANGKKFVYLDWKRGEAAPKPAGFIWNHRTGEKVALYRFPAVTVPLPIIPSVQDMKVCPLTGDKNFIVKSTAVYD
jgi:hypothetical protein